MSNDIDQIKKLLKTGKLVIGTEATLKMLRAEKLENVYIAHNCPEDVKADMERYTGLTGVKLIMLDVPNDELGDICKKPFSISVLGVLKE